MSYGKLALLSSAIMVLSGCGGSSGSSGAGDSAGAGGGSVSGTASLGIISGGLVEATIFNDSASGIIARDVTALDGSYQLDIPSQHVGKPLVIEIKASTDINSPTKMKCDVSPNCGEFADINDSDNIPDASGNLNTTIDFGEFYTLAGLSMKAVLPEATEVVEVNVTPLTTAAAQIAEDTTLPANPSAELLQSAIGNANAEVALSFGIPSGDLNAVPIVDLTDAESVAEAIARDDDSLRVASINSAVLGAVIEDVSSSAGDPVIENALNAFVIAFAGEQINRQETGANSANELGLDEILDNAADVLTQVNDVINNDDGVALTQEEQDALAAIQTEVDDEAAENDVLANEGNGSFNADPPPTVGFAALDTVRAFVEDLRNLGASVSLSEIGEGNAAQTVGDFLDQFDLQLDAADVMTSDAVELGLHALADSATAVVEVADFLESDQNSNNPELIGAWLLTGSSVTGIAPESGIRLLSFLPSGEFYSAIFSGEVEIFAYGEFNFYDEVLDLMPSVLEVSSNTVPAESQSNQAELDGNTLTITRPDGTLTYTRQVASTAIEGMYVVENGAEDVLFVFLGNGEYVGHQHTEENGFIGFEYGSYTFDGAELSITTINNNDGEALLCNDESSCQNETIAASINADGGLDFTIVEDNQQFEISFVDPLEVVYVDGINVLISEIEGDRVYSVQQQVEVDNFNNPADVDLQFRLNEFVNTEVCGFTPVSIPGAVLPDVEDCQTEISVDLLVAGAMTTEAGNGSAQFDIDSGTLVGSLNVDYQESFTEDAQTQIVVQLASDDLTLTGLEGDFSGSIVELAPAEGESPLSMEGSIEFSIDSSVLSYSDRIEFDSIQPSSYTEEGVEGTTYFYVFQDPDSSCPDQWLLESDFHSQGEWQVVSSIGCDFLFGGPNLGDSGTYQVNNGVLTFTEPQDFAKRLAFDPLIGGWQVCFEDGSTQSDFDACTESNTYQFEDERLAQAFWYSQNFMFEIFANANSFEYADTLTLNLAEIVFAGSVSNETASFSGLLSLTGDATGLSYSETTTETFGQFFFNEQTESTFVESSQDFANGSMRLMFSGGLPGVTVDDVIFDFNLERVGIDDISASVDLTYPGKMVSLDATANSVATSDSADGEFTLSNQDGVNIVINWDDSQSSDETRWSGVLNFDSDNDGTPESYGRIYLQNNTGVPIVEYFGGNGTAEFESLY